MAARACLFFFISLAASHLHIEIPPELVVWNVGQGQWVTLREEQICWHFDMGGEFAPFLKIRDFCRRRENLVSLSHWDEDHIGFLHRASRLLPQLCRLHSPVGDAPSWRKEQMLSQIPVCERASPFSSWVNPLGKTANDKSWVHLYKGVLAPGDSTRTQERVWLRKIPDLASTRILVLGHHGSRTSTSCELLFALPHLQMAVSSARYRRYKHPHEETVKNLREKRRPLLRTEEWGNLHFML